MSDKTVAELMALAQEYAHAYSFVGDDTMQRRRAELEQAIRRAVDLELVAYRWTHGPSELQAGADGRWHYSDTYLIPFSDRVIQKLYARRQNQ